MKCQYCDNPLPPNVAQCPSCGAAIVQAITSPQRSQGPFPGPRPGVIPNPVLSSKSRAVYILLGIFLGNLGIHNFYAGRTGVGIAQLLIVLLSSGFALAVMWIWILVELFVVDKDGKGLPFC